MSVPQDELMKMMQGQRGGGSMPPVTPDQVEDQAQAESSPTGSPMSTPEPKMGTREGAMINLSMAMDLIEQALPAFGSESPEGAKTLQVLRSLSGIIGGKKDKAKQLQNAEIMQMLQNLPQAGGATPEGKVMASAPAIPGMAPGGAPQPTM